MILRLHHGKAFPWHASNGVHVKGFIYFGKGVIHSQSLADFFDNIGTEIEFVDRLRECNGSFAVVINKPWLHAIACDRVRSMPLYYACRDGDWVVTDDAFREFSGTCRLDEASATEFMLAGFTTSRNTLNADVRQIQAGEYVAFENNQNRARFYYLHLHQYRRSINSHNDWLSEAHEVSMRVFGRLVASLDGRTAVLPLSGGYDSRYIACMLKRLGHGNTICYTYGRVGSHEVVTSQKVANRLGFKWHFIEYDDNNIGNMMRSEKYLAYIKYSHQFSSLPHQQDFLAMDTLVKQGVLPKDSVFVPGFCGDLLGGSYMPIEVSANAIDFCLWQGLCQYIAENQYPLFAFKSEGPTSSVCWRIQGSLMEYGGEPDSIEGFVELNEAWFTVHKVARFVVNSLRVQEYFGYEWRMPLWDNEFSEFWYSVPYTLKIGDNRLYNRFLMECVFSPFGVDWWKQKSTKRQIEFIRWCARLRVPVSWALSVKRLMARRSAIAGSRKAHFNAFDSFSAGCIAELKSVGMVEPDCRHVNAIYARWLLWKTYGYRLALMPIGSK